MLFSVAAILKPGHERWAYYDEASKRVLLAIQMGQHAKIEVSVYSMVTQDRESLEILKYSPATFFRHILPGWRKQYRNVEPTFATKLRKGFGMLAARIPR